MKENARRIEERKNVSTKKNTKVMVTSSVLMALGLVLHIIMPSAGIKPDFLLACMFIAITISENKRQVLAVTIASGILTAMTTNFPAGQLPSMIDKFISGFMFLALFNFIRSHNKESIIYVGIISAISTFVSGICFLTSVYFLGKIMGIADVISIFSNGVYAMVSLIVLPTSIANGFFAGLLYNVSRIRKR